MFFIGFSSCLIAFLQVQCATQGTIHSIPAVDVPEKERPALITSDYLLGDADF
jgi:hypothetical protein